MTIKEIKISNWKSFEYNDNPKGIQFNFLNIFIGPNSEGKTNLANAIRLICDYNPDYGGDPDRKGNIKILKKDFNINSKNQPIEISADVTNYDDPVKLIINPKDIGIRPTPNISLKKCNKFFPIGAHKRIFNLGLKENKDEKKDFVTKRNFKILKDKWHELVDEMDYFNIPLQPASPNNRKYVLSDLFDKNNQIFYEAGSGRTSVLYYLIEIKINFNKGVKSFLFDEPEINMHPSLLRKFLKYLSRMIDEYKIQFFITTHSSILIDYSILSDKAYVFQIKKEKDYSKVINISDDRKGLKDVVYNQLGYKPSDVLLANTVIWVEGPSDMIYLRHWLNEKDSKLEEGRDFTIMFYGGSLIKHLSFEKDIDIDALIELSTININSIIMIDSDIKRKGDKIGPNKKLVKKSFKANNRYVWITKGREVENYIDPEILEKAVKNAHPKTIKFKIGSKQYDKMVEIISSGHQFKKVKTAHEVVKIQRQDKEKKYFKIWDLEKKIEKLIKEIKK